MRDILEKEQGWDKDLIGVVKDDIRVEEVRETFRSGIDNIDVLNAVYKSTGI